MQWKPLANTQAVLRGIAPEGPVGCRQRVPWKISWKKWSTRSCVRGRHEANETPASFIPKLVIPGSPGGCQVAYELESCVSPVFLPQVIADLRRWTPWTGTVVALQRAIYNECGLFLLLVDQGLGERLFLTVATHDPAQALAKTPDEHRLKHEPHRLSTWPFG